MVDDRPENDEGPDDARRRLRRLLEYAGVLTGLVGLIAAIAQLVDYLQDDKASVVWISVAIPLGVLCVLVAFAYYRQVGRYLAASTWPAIAVYTSAIVSTLSLVAATIVLATASFTPEPPDPVSTSAPSPPSRVVTSAAAPSDTASDTACEAATGPAEVQPQLTGAGVRSGLRFCPVRINGGVLPIIGPFELAGQVVGPIDVRARVVLLNRGDPRSCDAFGKPPSRGDFLMSRVDVGSPDGRWSYVDSLGYPEAVTIARQFQYVTAPSRSIELMKNDPQRWRAANPGREDDYPGILSLPSDVEVLATFAVPSGRFDGSEVPCGGR